MATVMRKRDNSQRDGRKRCCAAQKR
ncbi:hypothetical protein CSHISOI_07862 [Colletotrichum shisoi]|uniref:Uncharacterized protein n=1 Tax=Colletotrichum shisoi TaxID=2078593 RepID=A0A5Q4BM55_9PEZI|nr:hypothetical protein CSHISOI_07862 [Colletotrichum shisoi]